MPYITERQTSREEIAAVIVSYQPSPGQLNGLLRVVTGECRDVFIINNGGARETLDERWLLATGVHCVDMKRNAGIGAALNCGFRLAKQAGASMVISFDQDSAPTAGMILELAAQHGMLDAERCPVAAVGPRFVDKRHGRTVEYPFMRLRNGWPRAISCADIHGRGIVESDFLITSGCLMSLTAHESIGDFDESLFVDCTDMEWGFRATARGYKLYGICPVIMAHELGRGSEKSILGVTLLGYSPVRRYYYARNTIRLIRLPYLRFGWKARLTIGLLARAVLLPFAPRSAEGWRREWRMFARGVRHGIAAVGGPFVAARGD